MTPFERFFATEFKKRLDEVGSEPGALSSGVPLSEASWDRKAAFLLWDALGRPEVVESALLERLAKDIFEDLLG